MTSLRTLALAVTQAALLAGCATTSHVQMDRYNEGQWQARALVRDLKSGKSHIVKLDIFGRRDKALRVDASAVLGQPVASMLWSDQAVDLILFENKKFYSGPVTPKLMEHVLQIPVDIDVWHDVVFDRPIARKDWSCTRDAQGQIAECTRGSSTKIVWYDRVGAKRTVKIEHAAGSVQIHFQDFQPKVENEAQAFSIKPPKGFTRFIL